MMCISRLVSGVVLLALSFPALAQTENCNFNDGSSAFSWQRVMDCYHSVAFNHDDLENAVVFIMAARERSDEREIFDERHGWRQSTLALDDPGTTADYPSDFAMQLAIVGNHKEFLNPHWRYSRPQCYTMLLGAFMPFDFGSDVERVKRGKPQQIFFIEDAPFLPELYEEFTGIDASQYIGMKILSINGVEPGEFFRNWGSTVLRFDENDGEHLNEILQFGAYSMRTSTTHDVPPAQASDTYVLQTANGQTVSVEMPWVFAPREDFGLSQWPLSYSDSDAEFTQRCTAFSLPYRYYGGAEAVAGASPLAAGRSSADAGETEFSRELLEKRNAVRALYAAHGGPGYFELPPGRQGQVLETIVPYTDGAVVKQLSDRATIIRLDSFVTDWKEEVIAGTDHACANSDRLVLDMRGNSGGYVSQTEWLVTHLFPDRTLPRDYSIPGRFLGSNTGRNELVEAATQFTADIITPALGFDCWVGYEAACYVEPDTNLPLSGSNWNAVDTVVEVRGSVAETLSPLGAFRNFDDKYAPGSDGIACPGKFQDDTLIVLSNGTGASAGHFFPELIREQATVVTAGGYLGETLASGIARGGAVWRMVNFESLVEQDLYNYFGYGPATDPLPLMRRDVEVYIEQPAAYLPNGIDLHVEQAPVGDVHIEVWADSPASDGYVYDRAINAVQKKKGKGKP